MSVNALALVLIVGASVAMSAAWGVAERTGKSGWGDAIWSFSIGGLGAVAAVAPIGGAEALTTRQGVVSAIALVWSLRLGGHIVERTRRGGEDPRYAQLREEWGPDAPRRLFWFFQIQAVAALLLALCIGLAARNPAPAFRLLDWLGFVVVGAAVVGEGVADRQLRLFRTRHAAGSAVCDRGLWSLSRHPNYFFQWLGWVGYAMIAIDPGGGFAIGWLSLVGPIAMYALLVHLSGIPPLEAHMLRSRGRSFEAYQQRVSPFWPLPKVGSATARSRT